MERNFAMTDSKSPNQIVISADDARGAKGPEVVARGDTLLPMLVALISLTVLAVGAVALFVRA
jgi:hypothetical protein